MPRMPKVPTRKDRLDRRAARRPAQDQVVVPEIHTPPRLRMMEKVKPLTDAQRQLDVAIKTSRIVFAVGPAGTGKTWFSTMMAAEALEAREISKIVIIRPAVEAGENLGFLPGDMDEKYAPYMRPFIDALEEKFGAGHVEYLMRHKIIEARPLAFLRGSTLKDCWVLFDEAQNVTPGQMKMLLTRIGKNAKFLISGDLRQSDIDGKSGLQDGMQKIEAISGVEVVTFTTADIVRDDICQDIVEAYENA